MDKEEKINFFEREIDRTIRFAREGKISANDLAQAWRNICFEVVFLSYEAGFNDGELGTYALNKWVNTCGLIGEGD